MARGRLIKEAGTSLGEAISGMRAGDSWRAARRQLRGLVDKAEQAINGRHGIDMPRPRIYSLFRRVASGGRFNLDRDFVNLLLRTEGKSKSGLPTARAITRAVNNVDMAKTKAKTRSLKQSAALRDHRAAGRGPVDPFGFRMVVGPADMGLVPGRKKR